MRLNPSFSNLQSYIHETVTHEPPELAAIRKRIYESDWPIHIAPEEGRLLQLLINLGGYKKIVEIGTHAGYSTLWMAMALPQDGKIYTIERAENRQAMAETSFKGHPHHPHAHKIDLRKGKALDQLKLLESLGPFDMLFIDADKLNYANYLDWGETHLRQGGLIIGDNTLLSGAVYGEPTTDRISPSAIKAIQAFNQRLGNTNLYQSVMLPTAEGWTMGIKQF